MAALPLAPGGDVEGAIDALLESGLAVIGDPDDATAQLERLAAQSGGFGCFLFMAHNWAEWSATRRSYELFARYMAPRFQDLSSGRRESMEWAAKNRPRFMGAVTQAIGQELQKHSQEQAARRKRE